jgi:hypothetical protein
MVVSSSGQFANVNTSAFEAYSTNSFLSGNYTITATQLGTAASIYEGNFPTWIAAGIYDILGKQQIGAAVAESDPNIGSEDGFSWNGFARVSTSDLATSGQLAGFLPTRAFSYGVAVPNFNFYLRSAADHVTPFTSGVVSGQINKDAAGFTVLASGVTAAGYKELGNGWYSIIGLTSGDMACVAGALHFVALGISGGSSDPCPIGFVTQRVSGR